VIPSTGNSRSWNWKRLGRTAGSHLASAGPVSGAAVVSGAASLAALVVASRTLGPRAAAPLAVVWTLAVVVGPGLWVSVEQEAARREASGTGSATIGRYVLRRSLLVGAVVGLAGWLVRDRVFAGSVTAAGSAGILAAAYGPLHLAWGRLAGQRRHRALAGSVVAEGALRLSLVTVAVVAFRRAGPVALALAGAVAATAVVATVRAGPVGGRGRAGGAEARPRLAGLTTATLLSQALLLGSPTVFAFLAPPGDPRTARFAIAVMLARAPVLAWKGLVAIIVPAVAARIASAAGRDTLPLAGRTAATLAAGLAVVAVPVALVAGDGILDLMAGPGGGLGGGALALLALATAAYLGAVTATSALAGAGRGTAAAGGWAVGVGVAVVLLAVPVDIEVRVPLALALASATVLLALVLHTVRVRQGGDATL
jgi:hypothetical protein